MIVVRGIALTVRFASELAMLAALAVGGHALAPGAAGWALALALPVLAGLTWGLFVAPKAVRPVPVAARLAIEALLFGGATWALAHAAHSVLAAILGVAACTSSLVCTATAPPRT